VDTPCQLCLVSYFKPCRTSASAGCLESTLNMNISRALLFNGHLVADLDLERWNIDLVAVDDYVTMSDKLAGLRAVQRKPKPEDHVVQTTLEQRQELFAGNALLTQSALVISPKLVLEDSVNSFDLLLFA